MFLLFNLKKDNIWRHTLSEIQELALSFNHSMSCLIEVQRETLLEDV